MLKIQMAVVAILMSVLATSSVANASEDEVHGAPSYHQEETENKGDVSRDHVKRKAMSAYKKRMAKKHSRTMESHMHKHTSKNKGMKKHGKVRDRIRKHQAH